MPWIAGIDEAGYGPNLGPFVMSLVACRVPGPANGVDLWQLLRAAVRRQHEPDDGRPLVEDSKVVYSTRRGLHALETSVLSLLASAGAALDLAAYVDAVCPGAHEHLRAEAWYAGTSLLPVRAERDRCREAAERFRAACDAAQLGWGLVRGVVVCPGPFNQLLDRWGTKGAVLGQALAELLQCLATLDGPDEPVHFYVDKHGGRNTYAAVLQQALPAGMVVAVEEGAGRSVYQVHGLGRPVSLTFQPRADAEHFCVALASMASKYVRELLMQEFNAFWQRHVPGLKPTAGYPGDALRFYEAIRPAMERLGIAEKAVWRRK